MTTNKFEKRLQDLFLDVLAEGAPLNKGAEDFVNGLLVAPRLSSRIKAVGILAKAGTNDMKEAAWAEIRNILTSERRLSADNKFTLGVILMQCLDDQRVGEDLIRRFVYKMAHDSRENIRCNSTVILRTLAQNGDSYALDLLKDALKDPDNKVQQNAKTFLLSLGEKIG